MDTARARLGPTSTVAPASMHYPSCVATLRSQIDCMHACRLHIYTAAAIGLAMGASAPGAAAARNSMRDLRFSFLSNINDGDLSGFGDAPLEVETTSGQSGVECHSSSDSGSYTEMRDAHVTAVSLLVADFCSPHFDGDAAEVYRRVEDFGGALASAFAVASAECVSSGRSSGCTAAKATAEAWADATASAHAVAASKLIDDCGCLKLNAGSITFGQASEFVKLTASTFAEAEVKACASGNQRSRASAAIECTAVAYVKVWGEVSFRTLPVQLYQLQAPPPCMHVGHVHAARAVMPATHSVFCGYC